MADLRIRASRVSQPMAPEELMAKLSNMSIQGLGMPSLPPPSDDGKDAVCFLCLEGGESHCDVTARAEAQMRDMHISPA